MNAKTMALRDLKREQKTESLKQVDRGQKYYSLAPSKRQGMKIEEKIKDLDYQPGIFAIAVLDTHSSIVTAKVRDINSMHKQNRKGQTMMLYLMIVVYFIVGGIQDFLSTVDVKAVQKNRAYLSATMGWINTILSYGVFYSIIISPNFLEGLLAYASGGWVGTVFGMKLLIKEGKANVKKIKTRKATQSNSQGT